MERGTVTEGTRRSFRLRALAWGLFVLAALLSASGLVLTAVKVTGGAAHTWTDVLGTVSFLAPAITFSIVGLIVALRRSENPAGWIMLVIGACWSVLTFPLNDVKQPLWLG